MNGKNITIEYRSDRSLEDLAANAAELERLGVDVLVAGTSARVLAAKKATATVPIVMVNVGDPVGVGLVASLGRPGGRVTGLSRQTTDLVGKTLQLLKEAAPGATRVAVLWTSTEPSGAQHVELASSAAKTLGMQLVPVEAKGADELEAAFASFATQRANALLVPPTSLLYVHLQRIAHLALQARLPSMYGNAEFVHAGGLMSYAPNSFEPYRHAAYYVDKILKGAKPADLPVEQPTNFELVINMKTAKALGLTIPPSLLLRADEVIR